MQTPQNETKLVAKPETTHMTAPVKMVKIKALRPIQIGEQIFESGAVVEVNEEQAKEYCDKKFTGYYPFSGERYEDANPSSITRAVRV